MNLKLKPGSSIYRVIASFLSKWIELFPTDETPLCKQKIKSANQKDWFVAFASSLSIRISNNLGPESTTQKKTWKKICKLQKQYEVERDLDKAGNHLIEISEQVKQLRDSFIHLHNRFYGSSELSKSDKALALRSRYPGRTDKEIAKEAGLAHPQQLYGIDGYTELVEQQRAFAKIRAIKKP